MRGKIKFAIVLIAAVLISGCLSQTPEQLTETSLEPVKDEAVETISSLASFEYPRKELILAPFVRPDYLGNKTWGLTVLECKIYASDEHSNLMAIRISRIEDLDTFDFRCILEE